MSRIINTVRETSNFDFLYGSFSLSKWTIPYFASTLSLTEAAEDLRTTAEMPVSANITWSLTELYQRDIDWMRVERQILPYLRSTDNPQFFNSITIALLPFDDDRGAILDKFADKPDWTAPDLKAPEAFLKQASVGPISFGFWSEWENPSDQGFRSGRLAWNKDQIFGVAIDGQHRLAAIKKLAESGQSGRLARSRVPVIFLVFDDFAGYQDPSETQTVEVLRALFIDLNKNAQTVKRGRQILLDDRDPHATCTRSVLAERLSDSSDSVAEDPPTLPLALVDWHSEQAKFETGPYLTTVLGLDWIVIKCLDTKPISDWTDYSAIERQIKRLNTRLNVKLESAVERLADLATRRMSTFSYSDEDLGIIRGGFEAVWQRPLVSLLTRFTPYRELIELRDAHNSFDLEFQEWFKLYEAKLREKSLAGESSKAYDKFLDAMALRTEDPRSEDDFKDRLRSIEFSKKDNLAFNVVFQKAIVDAFLSYSRLLDSDLYALSSDSDSDDDIDFGDIDSIEGETNDNDNALSEAEVGEDASDIHVYERRVSEFLDALNALVDGNDTLLDVEGEIIVDPDDTESESLLFWLGSILKSEGGIDFTQAASSRAKELILLAVMAYTHSVYTGTGDTSDFDTFWSNCRANSPHTPFYKVGKRTIDKLTADEVSVAYRIQRASAQDYDADRSERIIRDRVFAIWSNS